MASRTGHQCSVMWLLTVGVLFTAVAPSHNTPCICRSEREADSLELTVNHLAARVLQLEVENKDVRNLLAEVKAESAVLRDKMAASNVCTSQNRTSVAFHAWLKNSTNSTYGPIAPSQITTNVGDGYGQSGTFYAPVTGTYLFLITVGANGDSGMVANLVLMVQREVGAVAVSSDLHNPDTSTNHVIVTLTRGDYVWLRAEGYASFQGNHWTTFSGTLLFES